jgi:poly(3-hydroxybutyrate) depolymerase
LALAALTGLAAVSNAATAANCTSMPVSGKTYTIANEGSGLVLDVARKDTGDGADIIQWPSNGQTNQQWTLTDLGNGSWTIRPVHSNKALDLYGWSNRDGDPIRQWSYTGNGNQQWKLSKATSGGIKIASAHSKLLATVDGNKGTKLYQSADANSSAYQRWYFNPVDGKCDNAGTGGQPTPPAPTVNTGSAGCGGAAKFASGRYTLVSEGQTREFWINVPANYNPSAPLPLIVGLHWRGGQATDVYNGDGWSFYGLKRLYGDSAIFVAPNGLDQGWANYGDRDIRFIRAMVDQIKAGLCVDKTRVHAAGFSFGGMMSNAIGCQAGDVFRAIAPMAGALYSGCADSPNTVAAILIHSKVDPVVPYKDGEAARDKFLAKNKCSQTTRSVGTNGCVEYQGCSAGHPVVWCGYPDGTHWPPGFAAEEIKAFFDRF